MLRRHLLVLSLHLYALAWSGTSLAAPRDAAKCIAGQLKACAGVSPEEAARGWRSRCIDGDAAACARSGALAELGLWPPVALPTPKPAKGRAPVWVGPALPDGAGCGPTSPSACLRRAFDAIAAGRPADAVADARLACDAGLARGCVVVGQLALRAPGTIDSEGVPAFSRACALGASVGCSAEAMLTLRDTAARADPARQRRARVLLEEACRLGSPGACRQAADLLEESLGIPLAIGRAQGLRKLSCARDLDVVACRRAARDGMVDPAAAPDPRAAEAAEPTVPEAPVLDLHSTERLVHVEACRVGAPLACRVVRAFPYDHQPDSPTTIEACTRGDATACDELLGGPHKDAALARLDLDCAGGALDACVVLDAKAAPQQPSRACNAGAIARCFDDPERPVPAARRGRPLSSATPTELERACEQGLRHACLSLLESTTATPAAIAASTQVCNEGTSRHCLAAAAFLERSGHDPARARALRQRRSR